jgi:hypothetical protein
VSELTVKCGCGRTMSPDGRRGHGAYRCGCGARISVTAPPPPADRCVGRYNGEACRTVVHTTEPFPLCKPHYKESGLAEYHTWSNGTPEEFREAVKRKANEMTRALMDKHTDEAGLKQVGGRFIRKEQEPIVYFVRAGDLVKIGTTVNLVNRLKTFNVPSLVVLATEPGYHQRESELHRQFRDLRHQGEWFRLEGPLLEYINEIRARHDTPPINA